MAIRQLCGWETGDDTEAVVVVLSSSVQDTIKRSGSYALRVNPDTTETGRGILTGVGADGTGAAFGANGYYTFYIYIAALPGSGEQQVALVLNPSSTVKASITIDDSGDFRLYDSGGTQRGSTAATGLSLATWYRLDWLVPASTNGTSTLEVYDESGASLGSINGTGGNYLATDNHRLICGTNSNPDSQASDIYYDDIAISDSAFVGAHRILRAAPSANGSVMEWDQGTGPSDFTQVDEAPPNDGDYVQSSTSGAEAVALFAFQDAADIGIDVDDTINAVKLVNRVRYVSLSTSLSFHRIRSGSTNSDSGTANLGTNFVGRSMLAELDPDTSAAWTLSGFDGVEGGVIDGDTRGMRLSQTSMMVSIVDAGLSGVQVDVPLATTETTAFAPAVAGGASVAVPLASTETAAFAPAVAGGGSVTVPLAATETQAFAPTVTAGAAVVVPLASTETAAFTPTVTAGASVAVPLALTTTQAIAPTVAAGANLAVPVALTTTQAFAPIVGSAVIIAVPTATTETAAFAPTVSAGASLAVPTATTDTAAFAPMVAGGAAVSVPVALTVTLGYVPVVDAGGTILLPVEVPLTGRTTEFSALSGMQSAFAQLAGSQTAISQLTARHDGN